MDIRSIYIFAALLSERREIVLLQKIDIRQLYAQRQKEMREYFHPTTNLFTAILLMQVTARG